MKLVYASLAATLFAATSASAMVSPASPTLPRDEVVATGLILTHGNVANIAANDAQLPRDRVAQPQRANLYAFSADDSVNQVPTGLR